ncbi:uncharacterized protein JN550_004720 [Neoarthrinium moseri]|uniref:uncharacterized protein n=1 Tax=Neoarthrinium moseri TaxID=1658444 RepID=UPI001FDCD894|nr:uncharacterized protein JN550_004720 [Neoarthrinium moseri]KAI1871275.1 hypothetical protein JN550_004720 [Neoarthrinium moseri]
MSPNYVNRGQSSRQANQDFLTTFAPDLSVGFPVVDNNSDDFTPYERKCTGSSVFEDEYILEHGRTYQAYKPGQYFLPNDGEEQDRLDMQHVAIMLIMKRRLYWAPIEEPANVLDIGTGTGIWAIDFANEHPSSRVFGTDLSLIQPRQNVPPNCIFAREDAEYDAWTFDPALFDYVHLRMMFSCFDDPRAVMARARAHMAPGGWIEFQELFADFQSFDGSHAGTALERWTRLLVAGAAAAGSGNGSGPGRSLLRVRDYKRLLEAAGFVDVREELVPFPCSQWAGDGAFKDAGRFTATLLSQRGLEGVSLKLLVAAGLSPAEIRQLIADVLRDLRNRNIQ